MSRTIRRPGKDLIIGLPAGWDVVTKGGVTYRVRVEEDLSAKPYGCESDEIDAWEDGQWRYLTLSVTPVFGDLDVKAARAARCRVMYGRVGARVHGRAALDEHVVGALITSSRLALARCANSVIADLRNEGEALINDYWDRPAMGRNAKQRYAADVRGRIAQVADLLHLATMEDV